ncbi:hypothetical protein QR685DRAFT_582198 [Neurospora intermedia]|uniref:Uncharacterized protein n=1 Tax=Neurospora intermedia TaxID=5142 RepID=A0ABR3CYY9_NEUIN
MPSPMTPVDKHHRRASKAIVWGSWDDDGKAQIRCEIVTKCNENSRSWWTSATSHLVPKEASWACGSMVDAVFVARVKFKLEAVLEQKSPSTDSSVPYRQA